MDKRGAVAALYVDFSNGFNTLFHSVHVAKVESNRQADYEVNRNLARLPDCQRTLTNITQKCH